MATRSSDDDFVFPPNLPDCVESDENNNDTSILKFPFSASSESSPFQCGQKEVSATISAGQGGHLPSASLFSSTDSEVENPTAQQGNIPKRTKRKKCICCSRDITDGTLFYIFAKDEVRLINLFLMRDHNYVCLSRLWIWGGWHCSSKYRAASIACNRGRTRDSVFTLWQWIGCKQQHNERALCTQRWPTVASCECDIKGVVHKCVTDSMKKLKVTFPMIL